MANSLSKIYFYPIQSTIKILWYKKYNFLNLNTNFLMPKKINGVVALNSFRNLLQITFGFSKFNIRNSKLISVQILFQEQTHVYLNSYEKYTIIKPKFNIFFPNCFKIIQNKNILLLTTSFLGSMFLRIQNLKELLTGFQLLTLTSQLYTSNRNNKNNLKSFYFRKVNVSQTNSFYLIRSFPPFLSLFQKRINFFQFKSFLKKLLLS